jgi:uncharacterized protein (DUF1778 family)
MRRKTVRSPVDREHPLKTFVSPEERLAIESKAQAAGLTVSSYLRNAALSQPISSTANQQAFLGLLKVNADQGRLGGLLKLWLSTKAGHGAKAIDVRRLLREIEETQKRMRALIEAAASTLGSSISE